MLVSQQASDFANLILKHYDKPDKLEAKANKGLESANVKNESENSQDMKTEYQNNPLDKYNNDYSKWKNLEKEDEEKVVKDPNNVENYKDQMGCFHDRRKEREIFEKPTKEKLEAAERFKLEGNKCVSDKNYEKADFEYQKALLQFDYTFPDNPEDDKKMQELQESCHSNMALVQFHLKDYKESIHQAGMALKLNPANIKARYRKVCSLIEIDGFDQAQEEIAKAMEIDAKNTAILDIKKTLTEKIKQSKQKEKNLYQSMFSK